MKPTSKNPAAVEEEIAVPARVPLDSIRALVPPTYKLNYLVVNGGKRITPITPIQMMPGPGMSEVCFKFWGFDNYDVHQAFNLQYHEDDIVTVDVINYNIIVIANNEGPSIMAGYQHKFKHPVVLGLRGIYGRHSIFKFYRALEHLPTLPRDWQYMQFVG